MNTSQMVLSAIIVLAVGFGVGWLVDAPDPCLDCDCVKNQTCERMYSESWNKTMEMNRPGFSLEGSLIVCGSAGIIVAIVVFWKNFLEVK